MNNNQITLVITAHHARYLTEALLSVASQTSKQFNLVCCADVSYGLEDYKCFEEILPYIQCQKKLLLAIERNGTAGFVRNVGFDNAETEWIGYLDGDDLLHIDAVNYVRSILQDPCSLNVDIFSSGRVRIHTDGRLEPISDSLNYLPPLTIYNYDPELSQDIVEFYQFQIIRKSIWEAYKYDETTNGEDIDFMLHHLLVRHFKKIPKYLYYHRYTPNSFSSVCFAQGDICTRRYANGYYRKLFQEKFSPCFRGNFKNYN
ncbi:MAG: glycosyltransferase family 2 protein [Cuspidothrix sp.]